VQTYLFGHSGVALAKKEKLRVVVVVLVIIEQQLKCLHFEVQKRNVDEVLKLVYCFIQNVMNWAKN